MMGFFNIKEAVNQNYVMLTESKDIDSIKKINFNNL